MRKRFLASEACFTNEKFNFNILWNTRKVKSLFPLKGKVDAYSSVICKGDFPCGQDCIGETVRYFEIEWNEQEDKPAFVPWLF